MTKSNLIGSDNFANVAPGEGSIPTSVLKEPEWDIKTYPQLYPDGRNGMNSKGRTTNLSKQQYLKQRLCNVDKRFANDPAYLFSATSYIENQQLERNIAMSYSHGSKKKVSGNANTFQVSDPFFVFTKIKNTPQYWKQRRMELLAKLENKGAFQFFCTLSCGDSRWDSNFISFMHEMGIKVMFEPDKHTDEIVTKLLIGEETLTLEEYIKDKRYCNDTKHAQIRKNVFTATRNFNDRAKAFLKHIIMGKDNAMHVKYYNIRSEFQSRGAVHWHFVLWLNFDATFPNNIDNQLIKSVFNKFRHSENLNIEEEREIIKFIDTFVTCSSDPREVEDLLIRECRNKRAVAERAVEIAKTVNQHRHSRSCKKYGKSVSCRFHYPKLPSICTIITKPRKFFIVIN